MKASPYRVTCAMGLWIVSVLLLALVAACSVRPEALPPGSGLEQDVPPTPSETVEVSDQVSPGESKRPSQEGCPEVDSQLFQIAQASNPQELARQLQIEIKEDKIQVLLVLADQDTEFLQDFGVEAGTQYGTRVQAFVPVDRLCELASADQVLAIRRLDRAVTE
jgi:hypothetical protein